jgi:hypothetical protein
MCGSKAGTKILLRRGHRGCQPTPKTNIREPAMHWRKVRSSSNGKVFLLVYLAKSLFQFGDKRHHALPRLLVRSRKRCHVAILHDFHFEFRAFVF